MIPRSRSDEELAQFPLNVQWRKGREVHAGVISATDGDLWLESSATWPILQMPGVQQAPIEIKGASSRGPFYLSGRPNVRGGATFLRITDLRVGSDDPDVKLTSVTPHFDYVNDVMTMYQRDGSGRSPSVPLVLPALDDAPSVNMTFRPGVVRPGLELASTHGATLAEYETQLDAVQRLITFSTQLPVARRLLFGEDWRGRRVEVYRKLTVPLRDVRSVDHRDFPIRLMRADTQTIIDRWWAMMSDLRPIPHLLAALRWDPGYMEPDFLLLATALDRLSKEWTNESGPLSSAQFADLRDAARGVGVPSDYYLGNDPSFHTRVDALAGTLSAEVWAKLRVDRPSWLSSVKRHRNLVAHSSEQKVTHRKFLTGLGLPALRDTTDAVVTLVVAKHLGIDETSLQFAADRQYVKHLSSYAASLLAFTAEGIEDRAA